MATSKRKLILLHVVAYTAFFLVVLYLFYQYATGTYTSDFGTHIKAALGAADDQSYSLTSLIIVATYSIGGSLGVAVAMTLIEVATVAFTEFLLRKLVPPVKPGAALVLAFACNFVIAVFVPVVCKHFNVGMMEANPWHNTTILTMRLAGLVSVYAYLCYMENHDKRTAFAHWLVFTLFAIMATGFKPTFAAVIGPALFIVCVLDLVAKGRKTVPKSLAVGVSLLLTLAVVYVQYAILFPSESSENQVALGLAVVWRHWQSNIPAAFVLSTLFPLLVLLGNYRHLKTDRYYLLAWMVFAIALCEYVFIYEEGPRKWDGNFDWGTTFAMFLLFVSSAAVTLNNVRQRGIKDFRPISWAIDFSQPIGNGLSEADEEACSLATRQKAYYIAVTLAFVAHLASGLLYFARLLLGFNYY